MSCGTYEALGEISILNHPLIRRQVSPEWRPQLHKFESLNTNTESHWKSWVEDGVWTFPLELERNVKIDLQNIAPGNVD